MNKISIGPTGQLIQGTVFDCNKSSVESAFKGYDPLLYIKWNATKNHNMGCWELRRRPEKKSIKETIEFEGTKYHNLDYVELDVINHVLDMPILTTHFLDKLKRMDLWAAAGYDGVNQNKLMSKLDSIEAAGEKYRTDGETKAYNEAVYQLRQGRTVLNRFRNDILSGLNPAEIARYWDNQ